MLLRWVPQAGAVDVAPAHRAHDLLALRGQEGELDDVAEGTGGGVPDALELGIGEDAGTGRDVVAGHVAEIDGRPADVARVPAAQGTEHAERPVGAAPAAGIGNGVHHGGEVLALDREERGLGTQPRQKVAIDDAPGLGTGAVAARLDDLAQPRLGDLAERPGRDLDRGAAPDAVDDLGRLGAGCLDQHAARSVGAADGAPDLGTALWPGDDDEALAAIRGDADVEPGEAGIRDQRALAAFGP